MIEQSPRRGPTLLWFGRSSELAASGAICPLCGVFVSLDSRLRGNDGANGLFGFNDVGLSDRFTMKNNPSLAFFDFHKKFAGKKMGDHCDRPKRRGVCKVESLPTQNP